MFKKLGKFFAICGCLLLTLVVNGCGKNKDHVEFSYKGETIETFELVKMSSVSFDIAFIEMDGKDEIRHTSGVTYTLESKEYDAGTDFLFKVSGKSGYFQNYKIDEGKYKFDLTVKYDGEEYEFDFEFVVYDSYDYVTTAVAEAIVENDNYSSSLKCYTDSITSSSGGVLFMVDGKKDDTLEIFSMISSSGIDVMATISMNKDGTFDFEYAAEYNDTAIAAGSGTYNCSAVKTTTNSVSLTTFAATSGSRSTHEVLAAQLLHLGLLGLHSYAQDLFPNLLTVSFPYCLGFTSYSLL